MIHVFNFYLPTTSSPTDTSVMPCISTPCVLLLKAQTSPVSSLVSSKATSCVRLSLRAVLSLLSPVFIQSFRQMLALTEMELCRHASTFPPFTCQWRLRKGVLQQMGCTYGLCQLYWWKVTTVCAELWHPGAWILSWHDARHPRLCSVMIELVFGSWLVGGWVSLGVDVGISSAITSQFWVYFRVPSEGEASARTETPRWELNWGAHTTVGI